MKIKNKVFLFIPILFIAVNVFAGANEGCTKPVNVKYSHKYFPDQNFLTVDPSEFNNTCIFGLYIYQLATEKGVLPEIIMRDVFPSGMTGVEFVACNLDNVIIPFGNTVHSTSINRRIQLQNDLEDWILNVLNKPIEPRNKAARLKVGVSISPADIPLTRFTKGQSDAFYQNIIDNSN